MTADHFEYLAEWAERAMGITPEDAAWLADNRHLWPTERRVTIGGDEHVVRSYSAALLVCMWRTDACGMIVGDEFHKPPPYRNTWAPDRIKRILENARALLMEHGSEIDRAKQDHLDKAHGR